MQDLSVVRTFCDKLVRFHVRDDTAISITKPSLIHDSGQASTRTDTGPFEKFPITGEKFQIPIGQRIGICAWFPLES